METQKPFWKSRTLWGVLMSVCGLGLMLANDNGAIHMSSGTNNAVIAINFLGLGLAGYGRLNASKKVALK